MSLAAGLAALRDAITAVGTGQVAPGPLAPPVAPVPRRADPVAFGPYGPTADVGPVTGLCVCDCAQSAADRTCWQCGRPARGWRGLLQTAN